MAPLIHVANLGKRYHVALDQRFTKYRTLRESVVSAVQSPWRRLSNGNKARTPDDFWALRDVSFDVKPGEVVGIVGGNGAGKSTLLKILSRITMPTEGYATLRGRIVSLLEVGTGFHAELTGRENIYLNGSILGMSRDEVSRKFDQIVAFAEVEHFLDTPVKRYSSGMYVRLAFSVAAFLEPEILLVDEVLAVGDAVFQRKCIERMTQLAHNGCALLFVSHNLELIARFCDRAVLLNNGRLTAEGATVEILDRYRDSIIRYDTIGDLTTRRRRGRGLARFTSLEFVDNNGTPLHAVNSCEDLRCVLAIESTYSTNNLSLAIGIRSTQGSKIITSWTEEVGFKTSLTPGTHRFECRFKSIPLRSGRQVVFDLWMHDGDIVDYIEDARLLDVVDRQQQGYSHQSDQGHALCPYEWSRL